MSRFLARCLGAFIIITLAVTAAAADRYLDVAATARPAAVAPGGSAVAIVRLTIHPPYHVNANPPANESLVPLTVAFDAAPGFRFGTATYPRGVPLAAVGFSDPSIVYSGSAEVRVPLTVGSAVAPGNYTLAGKVDYQACDDRLCFPPASATFSLPLKVVAATGAETAAAATPGETDTVAVPPETAATVAVPAPETAPIPGQPPVGAAPNPALMLLFAFVGGLLLNLMPCVFPVLALKVLGVVRQAHAGRAQAVVLGLAYTAGILVSFAALAGIVVALRAAGTGVGWGFQFQEPGFVAVFAAIITAFTMAMFGVFEVNLPGAVTTTLYETSKREGWTGAFLDGMFATLLATPCTAPFLGSAMGFAFAQPTALLVLFFLAVGFGLALPFLLLALFPRALALVPKPGAWMVTVKQGLGFLLLATLLWLLYVVARLTSLDVAAAVAAFILALGFVLWVAAHLAGPTVSTPRRRLVWAAVLALAVAGYLFLIRPLFIAPAAAPEPAAVSDGGWLPYSAEALAGYRAAGRIVFLDVGADWCWTCQVNEAAVLGTDGITAAFKKYDVVQMKADWTRRDAAVTALLESLGRAGVPAYAIYPGAGDPEVLPELLTTALVADALARAAAPPRQGL